jgi:hypothetical protein
VQGSSTRHSANALALRVGSRNTAGVNPNDAPVNLLYALLSLIVIGFGVGILVWQTAATRQALATRGGFLFAGVVLILLGGAVFLSQTVAYFT